MKLRNQPLDTPVRWPPQQTPALKLIFTDTEHWMQLLVNSLHQGAVKHHSYRAAFKKNAFL